MSLPLETSLQNALDTAPVLSISNGRPEVPALSYLADLRGLPDNQSVHVNVENLPVDGDNTILVVTPTELEALLQELETRGGRNYFNESVEHMVEHEEQHATAAKMLGATAVRYGVTVWRSNEGNTHWQPFSRVIGLKTSKLGFGSLIGYPRWLSEGDLYELGAIGYTVEGVAEKALSCNASAGFATIPVPLSYRQ